MNDLIQSFPNKFKRFPTSAELEQLELGFEPNTSLVQNALITPSPGILIDVTHTYIYPYHSGIQRTVRSFVCALKDIGKSAVLIRFDGVSGQPVLLTTQEVDQFFNWNQFISSQNHRDSQNEKKLVQFLKPLKKKIPPWIWNNMKALYVKVRSFVNKDFLNKIKIFFSDRTLTPSLRVLDLRHRNVILPEVISEEFRIEMIEVLSAKYSVKFSAIVYDLIPLTHPEYCTIGYGFIHYLRIFRCIHQAICISKHTAMELKNVLNLIPRTVQNELLISSQYLGGDFSGEHPTSVMDQTPIILMVARFEPRKNIRRVLQAMVRLQNQELKFKFVVVGNPGWKQEEIFEDLDQYISKGYNIEYHLKIQDSELLRWYQKSYFTIFCSIVEGLGLPVIESVLLHKPCITTNSGSQNEVADLLGGCVKVDPLSISEIESATKQLLADTNFYNQLVQQTKSANWPSWSDYAKEFTKNNSFVGDF
jgi:glycosyltransferase involved in cell wall biosynthesis